MKNYPAWLRPKPPFFRVYGGCKPPIPSPLPPTGSPQQYFRSFRGSEVLLATWGFEVSRGHIGVGQPLGWWWAPQWGPMEEGSVIGRPWGCCFRRLRQKKGQRLGSKPPTVAGKLLGLRWWGRGFRAVSRGWLASAGAEGCGGKVVGQGIRSLRFSGVNRPRGFGFTPRSARRLLRFLCPSSLRLMGPADLARLPSFLVVSVVRGSPVFL